MKKIILSAFAVISLGLASQAQFRLGVKAGGSLSDQRMNVSHGNTFSDGKYKSYHAGLITDFRIAENVYLQPQLLYARKGSTVMSTAGAADAKVRFNYLEVPVNVVYKLPVSFGKIFAGAGPSFSYAFSGKQEQAGHKTNVFGSNGNWKREDLSLSFTAGVEFNNGLFASINSQKGFMDVYKTDGVSVKNKSISASIGYMIDWKQLKKKG